ncbi:MAG: hypothetical protein NC833_06845, partial [Candidatus Omnitrophica bacterium]|nr:hypothetical protein [Candidatus Omnitrophota bacterium]
KIKGEIYFSDQSFKNLKAPFSKIFQKELPQNLKINGYLRGKTSAESEKFEFDYLYIYIFSDIDSIIFSQVKNDVEMLLPSLGIIMKDKKENVNNLIKSQKTKDIELKYSPLPINFFSYFFEYLISKENEIKEKIKFEREGKRENFKTYIYNYPYDNGNINIEILDKFYTFSKIKIIGKDKTELTLNYSIPEKEVKVSIFLPNSITLNTEKDKNKLFLDFLDIQYNKLFSENDFKIKEMNFPETITSIYMKILKEAK